MAVDSISRIAALTIYSLLCKQIIGSRVSYLLISCMQPAIYMQQYVCRKFSSAHKDSVNRVVWDSFHLPFDVAG